MSETKRVVCNTCGATLDPSGASDGLIKCEFCNNVVQLPRFDSSDKAIMAIRSGEQSLRNGEFGRAMSEFALAAEEAPSEAMGYWGMALAKFKVQYIKDHTSDTYHPIVFGISKQSFLEDKNYLKALDFAGAAQKMDYEEKAEEIEHIRKEFQKFEDEGLKYDAFICVKVSDETKGLTDDSKAASYYYNLLTRKGYKPFYSEMDIRNRTGADYEAMILYALSKAKTMLLICFDESYLNTPWVKNEYSRYIAFSERDGKDDNIAVIYKGTPIEELNGKHGKIQGIDFASRGADLAVLDFIKNAINKEKNLAKGLQNDSFISPKTASGSDPVNLMIRGEQEYLNGHLDKAKEYYRKAVDTAPTSFKAWLGNFYLQFDVLPPAQIPLYTEASNLEGYLNITQKNDYTMSLVNGEIFKTAKRYASEEEAKQLDSTIEDLKKRKLEADKAIADKLEASVIYYYAKNQLYDLENSMGMAELALELNPDLWNCKWIYFLNTNGWRSEQDAYEEFETSDINDLNVDGVFNNSNFQRLLSGNISPEARSRLDDFIHRIKKILNERVQSVNNKIDENDKLIALATKNKDLLSSWKEEARLELKCKSPLKPIRVGGEGRYKTRSIIRGLIKFSPLIVLVGLLILFFILAGIDANGTYSLSQSLSCFTNFSSLFGMVIYPIIASIIVFFISRAIVKRMDKTDNNYRQYLNISASNLCNYGPVFDIAQEEMKMVGKEYLRKIDEINQVISVVDKYSTRSVTEEDVSDSFSDFSFQ